MTSILSLLAGLLLSFGGPVTGLSIQPAPERTEVVISMEGQAEKIQLILDILSQYIELILVQNRANPIVA